MKATELRIGNWYCQNGEYYKATAGDIVLLEALEKVFQPIPITDEWLVKFGFDGNEQDRWMVLPNGDGSELHIEKEMMSDDMNILFTRGDSTKIPGKDFDYVYAGEIKHLHQLQNLYFALTGEEL